jgi:hypothetical protein
MRTGLIGLASAMVLASTMATAGCGRTGITGESSSTAGTVATGGSSSTAETGGTDGSSTAAGTGATRGSSASAGTMATGGGTSTAETGGTGGSSTAARTGGTGGSSSTARTGGTGGSSTAARTGGTGGSSSSTVGEVSCSNVLPCGGDIVGTWAVTSSCLKITGEMDLSSMGLGCKSAPVTGALQVSGTWTANSNGKYTDNTITSGTEQLTLPASCLQVSGTTASCEALNATIESFGYESGSVNCKNAASGGGCTCPATIKQTAGLGLLSVEPTTTGKYTTSGNVVTTDNEKKYSYCVSGNKMAWTPQSTSPTTTGTVLFQKQ